MAKKKAKAATSAEVATFKIVQSDFEATPVNQESPPPQQDSVGNHHPDSTLQPEGSVGGLHNDSLYREGREALHRIETGREWADWLKVSAALDAARAEAMKTAGVNQPIGATYNKAFGEVLEREGLGKDKLDSATRNQLFKLYEHRSSIEEWRAKLPHGRRSKLNHPSSVFRNWSKTEEGRAALGKKPPPPPNNRKRTAAELLNEQVERVEQLQARLEEVEQERDQHKREAAAEFTEPMAAFTTLVSMGHSLQLSDLPKEVNASDLLNLAERIRQLAADMERFAEETVH